MFPLLHLSVTDMFLARAGMEMRKSAEDTEDAQHEHSAVNLSQKHPSLRSPVTSEPRQPRASEMVMKGAYGSRTCPHGMLPPRRYSLRSRSYPREVSNVNEIKYGSQAYQMDERSMDDLPHTPSSQTPYNQESYTQESYTDQPYNQATWSSPKPIQHSMTDSVAYETQSGYGTGLSSFNPSSELIMRDFSREDSYRGMGGMRDASESIEGNEMEVDASNYMSHEEAEGRFKKEHYSPGQAGSSPNMFDHPKRPHSLPQTPQIRFASDQSHKDNNKYHINYDSKDFLEGVPTFMEKIINPPGSPAKYMMDDDGRLSSTANSNSGYDSMIEGFEAMNGARYPAWRNIGEGRRDSRYAGGVEPWPCNTVPPVVLRSSVSDASLLKRGLPLTHRKKVIKRAYGVNDPENIALINMKDNQGMSWRDIVDVLNEQRVAAGKTKFLSVTAVANRYSRNCPVLMAAAGLRFVPLRLRRDGGMEAPRIDWTEENDVILVNLFKAHEASRWETVAEEFQEETGIEVHPMEVARRYSAIN